MTETARLARLLASRLQALSGAAAEITGLQRLPGGASRESWDVQAGLHCDLQNEHAIVGNNVGLLLMLHYGSAGQQQEWVDDLAAGRRHFAFGITAFLVPADAAGFTIQEYLWTFNMPTDHAHASLAGVRVPGTAVFGGEGRGLQVAQHFFSENRIRQAASSLGAAQFCIDRSVEYATIRAPFGRPLASNQAIQFPLVELQTQGEMLRALIHKTAWAMDRYGPLSQSDKVSMCNFVANCRYRITEGAEEIQMRRVAGYMFGFMKQQAPKGVPGTPADRSGA